MSLIRGRGGFCNFPQHRMAPPVQAPSLPAVGEGLAGTIINRTGINAWHAMALRKKMSKAAASEPRSTDTDCASRPSVRDITHAGCAASPRFMGPEPRGAATRVPQTSAQVPHGLSALRYLRSPGRCTFRRMLSFVPAASGRSCAAPPLSWNCGSTVRAAAHDRTDPFMPAPARHRPRTRPGRRFRSPCQ